MSEWLTLFRTQPISRIVSSDLEGCNLLAESLAAPRLLQVDRTPSLREAHFGVWEGLTYDQAMADDRAAMVRFNRDPAQVSPPGGESLAASGARALALFRTIVKEHRHREGALLLVSHGGTLRALLCLLLEIPLSRYWTLRVDNASLTCFDLYPMGPIIEILNDTSHLRGLPG